VDGISQPAHRTDTSQWQYGPFGGLSFDAAQFFRRFLAQRRAVASVVFSSALCRYGRFASQGQIGCFFSSADEDSCLGLMQRAARP